MVKGEELLLEGWLEISRTHCHSPIPSPYLFHLIFMDFTDVRKYFVLNVVKYFAVQLLSPIQLLLAPVSLGGCAGGCYINVAASSVWHNCQMEVTPFYALSGKILIFTLNQIFQT